MTQAPKRSLEAEAMVADHPETLADRFIRLVEAEISTSRRWAWLEQRTGIAATSWQKACSSKQRPTAEMIEAVGRLWPDKVHWLVTGQQLKADHRAIVALDRLQKLDFKLRADGKQGLPIEACRIIQSAISPDQELADG